jgi:hypothetical protein
MINMGTASFCFNSYPDRGRGSMLVGLLGRLFYMKTALTFSYCYTCVIQGIISVFSVQVPSPTPQQNIPVRACTIMPGPGTSSMLRCFNVPGKREALLTSFKAQEHHRIKEWTVTVARNAPMSFS